MTDNNYSEKDRVLNFYHLNIRNDENDTFDLPKKMKKIFKNFKRKNYSKIPELFLHNSQLFIDEMRIVEPINEMKNEIYVFNVARVEIYEPIEMGDISKRIDQRKKIYHEGKNSGPLKDTQYLIDPNKNIICTCRGNGRNTNLYTEKFLKNIFKVNSLKMDIVLNKKGYSSISKMNLNKLSLSVASPDKFSDINKNNSIISEIDTAKQLTAETIKVEYTGSRIDGKKIHNIINSLSNLRNDTNTQLKKMEVSGINSDGIHESIDLIKNKLTKKIKIRYIDKITAEDFMDAMIEGFENSYSELNKIY